MKRTAIRAALPIILLWAVLLSAQDSTGVIRGRVVDAVDGSGIENTDVYLLGATIYGGRVVATESGGYFIFNDLAPGKYSVRVYPEGYLASTSLDVTLDSTGNKDVPIKVQKPVAVASFNGTVRDSKDRALVGVKVCVERKIFNEFGDVFFSTNVRPTEEGSHAGQTGNTRITIGVTGNVFDVSDNGGGPDGASCGDSDTEGHYTTNTVDAGEYVLKAFPSGTASNLAATYYPGAADPRDALSVVVGRQPVTGIDIRMEQQARWTIRGEINAATSLSTDTEVIVSASRDGERVSNVYAYVVPGKKARAFEIRNLSEGTYDLEVVAPGSPLLGLGSSTLEVTPTQEGFTRVEVRSEDVNNVEIALDPEATIAATVLLPGQVPEVGLPPLQPASDQRLGGAFILLRGITGDINIVPGLDSVLPISIPDISSRPTPTLICRNGHFVIGPLTLSYGRGFAIRVPRADCLLQVRNLPADDFVESAKLDGEEIWDRTFVPSPSASSLLVTLAEKGGGVSGRIVDESGDVFSGPTTVVLVPVLKPSDHLSADIRFQLGATGQFTLSGVRPGAYHVLAISGGADSSPYYNNDLLRDYELRGAPVTITGGDRTSVNTTVIRLP